MGIIPQGGKNYNAGVKFSLPEQRKGRPHLRTSFWIAFIKTEDGLLSLLIAHLGKALAAVDRTVGLGLEGNASLAAAGSAHSGEILAGAAGGVLASITAGLAALGLVLEAALCIELLLTGGEHELLAALLAH
jgi:hypothetical protein